MKKVLLTVLAVAVALTAAAKKKPVTLTIDFANGNPFTAVQGTTEGNVTLNNPALGFNLPTKWVKTTEAAEAVGYVSCPNPEKGEEGFYLPFSKQSFTSNGKTYEIVIGTNKTPGRRANLNFSKGLLVCSKIAFTFPKVEGQVPAGIKVYTQENYKGANERTYLRICKDKISSKTEVTHTNPALPEEDTVLAATIDGVTAEDNLIVYTYAGFRISQIQFIYKPVDGKKKK